MEITVKSNFLVFPVNSALEPAQMKFWDGDTVVYAPMVKLDAANPTVYAYLDVKRFWGKTLKITVEPETEIVCREADTIDIPDV